MVLTQPHARAESLRTTLLCARSPLPEPLLEVLSELQRGEPVLESLRSCVAGSERLGEHLVRFANSAYFPGRTVSMDPCSAVRRIGSRTLVGLAIADAIGHEFLADGLVWYGHRPCGLLSHSLAVAQSARGIAETLGLGPRAGGAAFVAGLFHDLGKIEVVDQLGPFATRSIRETITDVPPESSELTRIERLTVGFSHEEASHAIAASWGMSERVCTQIASMHEHAGTSIGTQVLRLADAMVTAIGVGYFDALTAAERFGDRVQDFGAGRIDSAALLEVCQRIALRESARAVMVVQAIEPVVRRAAA